MERLEILISKLKEQFEKNAPASQLLVITKQIEGELARSGSQRSATIGTAKVAVVMPSAVKLPAFEEESVFYELSNGESENRMASVSSIKKEPGGRPFDPVADTPTLAHQPGSRELNDVMGNSVESLNDKLKGGVPDLAATLKDSPLRDLKKAIGINDRFVFISELFRGDEAMYERSIKTINNFRILSEAEYWMIRELKVKLAWDDDKETTRHFYQLVKRRFS